MNSLEFAGILVLIAGFAALVLGIIGGVVGPELQIVVHTFSTIGAGQ